jgi:hypothetical protein
MFVYATYVNDQIAKLHNNTISSMAYRANDVMI